MPNAAATSILGASPSSSLPLTLQEIKNNAHKAAIAALTDCGEKHPKCRQNSEGKAYKPTEEEIQAYITQHSEASTTDAAQLATKSAAADNLSKDTAPLPDANNPPLAQLIQNHAQRFAGQATRFTISLEAMQKAAAEDTGMPDNIDYLEE